MDVLSKETLTTLAGHKGWPAVSVYLPTHRFALQTDEDRIRLKNLLRQACDRLVEDGMRKAEAEAFCAPIRAMLDDKSFWQGLSDGLAIFVTATSTQAHRVDTPLPEQFVVGDRFYLRPLLSAYRTDESFWALALDKNGSRLFRGDRAGIEQVSLGDTPVSMDEAMKYEDATRNLTTHSFMPGRVSSRGNQHEGSNYAGYGGEKDVDIEQTTRFARLVERGVQEALRESHRPLILFGVDRLVAAYREVNTYNHLADEQVLGASDYLSPQQVQSRGLEALSERFASTVKADLSELNELEGSALTSHDPAEIVGAAALGRVKTLFFDDRVGPFGVFDRETFEVAELCDSSPRYLREQSATADSPEASCGWDLVDLAAAETALHAGEIRAFTGESSPIEGVAAVYRY